MLTRLVVVTASIYTYIKSICCITETNIMLYVKYISILKKVKITSNGANHHMPLI